MLYYSDQELLPTTKLTNGYREYDPKEIPRAKRVHCLLAAGIPCEQVWKIRGCLGNDSPGICREMQEAMSSQIDSLEQRIRRLEMARDTLKRKIRDGGAGHE
ncbi:MAG: MerR family transcriptional regulator [Microbacteriaceae bacterium]|jgi:DNA-binding transcriptional MerR regulator|nr:MerR family transcriptional regulator [Microbacteriaceae bacterium]